MPRRAKINLEAIKAEVERTIKADEQIISVRLTCGHEARCQVRYARWMVGKGVGEECNKS